jgi:hypothetical protein
MKRYCSDTQRMLFRIKEAGPEGNVDKAKYMFMFNEQRAVQNHDMNVSFNVVGKF